MARRWMSNGRVALKLDDGTYLTSMQDIKIFLGATAPRIREKARRLGFDLVKIGDIPDDEEFIKAGGVLFVNAQTLCSYRTVAEAAAENFLTVSLINRHIRNGDRYHWYTVSNLEEYKAYCDEVKKTNEEILNKKEEE